MTRYEEVCGHSDMFVSLFMKKGGCLEAKGSKLLFQNIQDVFF
jgi:hypothetical protein